MNTRLLLCFALIFAGLIAGPAAGQDDELADLRERFKQRYPTLVKLKDAQKIGEIHTGYAGAVKSAYLDDEATDEQTVREFLAAENRDRERLYQIMADKTDTTPEEVAATRAAQLFEQGKADWYFKPVNKDWMLKKNIE